ncbi:MAG: phosphoglucosamine mutase, partial [Candidatus Margulisbacteria bacterium]|nr:phosphoglucosamine mutase [Candidatus Margulisiibacteriota bacterium]
LGDKATVVVGTDPRSSSEFIKGIIFSGLMATGCKVIDLGICPTPTVGIMVRELKASGGIIITASHNPLPWNGLKFVRSDGIFLNEAQATEFLKIYEQKAWEKRAAQNIEVNHSAVNFHIKKVLDVINKAKIRRKKFRVAIDACNGAGSEAVQQLLIKLGCTVIPINCDLSLPFPHDPEPIAENLGELVREVKRKKADIGFALDSDADRLAIVDNNGKPIGEELTLALAAKFVLAKKRSKKKIIVTNLSTTRALDDIAKANKAIVIRTKIGEVHVAEEIKHLKALIGGEGNGGVIYPAVGYNRDSLAGIALILNLMADTGKPISKLAQEIPAYFMIKKKVQCHSLDEAEQFLANVKEKFRKKDLILTEGVKVISPTGWVHVRPSNTEPVIRVIAEAKEKNQVKNLIKQVLSGN